MAIDTFKLDGTIEVHVDQFNAGMKSADQQLTRLQQQMQRGASAQGTLQTATTRSAHAFTNHNTVLAKSTTNAAGLSASVGNLTRGLSAMGGPAGSAAASLSGMAASAGTASASLGPLGLAIGAFVVVSAGAVVAFASLAKGLYDITIAGQDAEGKIYDLSQKTNFSAETLSTLGVAAKLAGGDVNSMGAALTKFNLNLEEARVSGSEMEKTFNELGIVISDNETSLRSAFKALQKMNEGSAQSAASTALFSKGGREMMGVLKALGGDVDTATGEFRKLNLVMSTAGTEAADRFSDKLGIVGMQIDALKRRIAGEAAPEIERALDLISGALSGNAQGWSWWGAAIRLETANVVSVVRAAAGAIQTLIATSNPLRAWAQGLGTYIRGMSDASKREAARARGEFVPGEARVGGTLSDVPYFPTSTRTKSSGGGGGGGSQRIDPAAEAMRARSLELQRVNKQMEADTRAHIAQLEKEYENNLIFTQGYVAAVVTAIKKLANAQLLALNEEAEIIRGTVKNEIDQQAQLRALADRRTEIERKLYEDIYAIERKGVEDRKSAFESQQKADLDHLAWVDEWAKRIIAARYAASKLAQAEREGDEGLTGGKKSIAEIFAEQDAAMAEHEEMMRSRMESIAGQMTSIFDNALNALVTEGFGGFFREILRGFADMLRQMALQWLQAQIFKALIGLVGGVAGGGSKLGLGLGNLTGKASGGPVAPFGTYLVGEKGPELLQMGGQGGRIIPNGAMVNGGSVVNINVYARDAASFNAPSTRNEIARQYRRQLEASTKKVA